MSHFSARWQQRYVTNKKVIPHFYLISKILKINNVTIVYNNFFSNSTSKDLLQGYSAYNSCNWKPSFHCRSECVKLDIPDNQLIINIYGWLHTIQHWYFFFSRSKVITIILIGNMKIVFKWTNFTFVIKDLNLCNCNIQTLILFIFICYFSLHQFTRKA